MSRRGQIAMSDAEVAAFLGEQRTVMCASNGHRGWPHVMPLWYLMRGEDVWAWTYAKSQKVRNLERDPRATLQVEAGEQYHELRGVMIEAETTVHRDLETVSEFGVKLFERYSGGQSGAGPEFLQVVRAQAAKRVALQFSPQRVSSWDHGKLGGVY
jgi:PPOX class probable F420-dependent enzyme